MGMQAIDGAGAETLTKTQVAELKLRYGDELVSVEQSDGTYVFRAPSRMEWRRYMNALLSDDKRRNADRSAAAEQLCADCLVWPRSGEEPDVPRLRTLFERKPGLPMTVAAEIGDLAGAGESVRVGKL